jgi:hypothetical protein
MTATMSRWNVRCRQMRACVPVKMRQVEASGACSAKDERKKTEAETDCETDQVEV